MSDKYEVGDVVDGYMWNGIKWVITDEERFYQESNERLDYEKPMSGVNGEKPVSEDFIRGYQTPKRVIVAFVAFIAIVAIALLAFEGFSGEGGMLEEGKIKMPDKIGFDGGVPTELK